MKKINIFPPFITCCDSHSPLKSALRGVVRNNRQTSSLFADFIGFASINGKMFSKIDFSRPLRAFVQRWINVRCLCGQTFVHEWAIFLMSWPGRIPCSAVLVSSGRQPVPRILQACYIWLSRTRRRNSTSLHLSCLLAANNENKWST